MAIANLGMRREYAGDVARELARLINHPTPPCVERGGCGGGGAQHFARERYARSEGPQGRCVDAASCKCDSSIANIYARPSFIWRTASEAKRKRSMEGRRGRPDIPPDRPQEEGIHRAKYMRKLKTAWRGEYGTDRCVR